MRSDQLRVGQFLSHFPERGGSTTVLLGLASGLLELGHDVVAYGYGQADCAEAPSDLESKVFPQPRVRSRALGRAPLSDRLRARIAANRDQLDILIVHGMWSAYSWGLLRAARRARISCIAQPHDPYSPAALASAHTRKRAYWRLVERPFLRGVDAVQLYAPSHREHLERLGVATSSFVVPAGLDARQFEQAAASAPSRFTDRRPDQASLPGTIRRL